MNGVITVVANRKVRLLRWCSTFVHDPRLVETQDHPEMPKLPDTSSTIRLGWLRRVGEFVLLQFFFETTSAKFDAMKQLLELFQRRINGTAVMRGNCESLLAEQDPRWFHTSVRVKTPATDKRWAFAQILNVIRSNEMQVVQNDGIRIENPTTSVAHFEQAFRAFFRKSDGFDEERFRSNIQASFENRPVTVLDFDPILPGWTHSPASFPPAGSTTEGWGYDYLIAVAPDSERLLERVTNKYREVLDDAITPQRATQVDTVRSMCRSMGGLSIGAVCRLSTPEIHDSVAKEMVEIESEINSAYCMFSHSDKAPWHFGPYRTRGGLQIVVRDEPMILDRICSVFCNSKLTNAGMKISEFDGYSVRELNVNSWIKTLFDNYGITTDSPHAVLAFGLVWYPDFDQGYIQGTLETLLEEIPGVERWQFKILSTSRSQLFTDKD